MHTSTYVHPHRHTSISTSVCSSIHTYTYTHVHTQVYIHTARVFSLKRTYSANARNAAAALSSTVRTCISAQLCTCVCMCVCKCISLYAERDSVLRLVTDTFSTAHLCAHTALYGGAREQPDTSTRSLNTAVCARVCTRRALDPKTEAVNPCGTRVLGISHNKQDGRAVEHL
jgi:hypothetical protein